MELTTVWFLLIALLWTGYLVLEGFDFGVGMLLPVVGRGSDAESTDTNRRVLLNTIGPVWDGNEVWLLVAGGATFAAFPEWYATLFSGFYLPLLLILLALIGRGVAFEYRGKVNDPTWRRRWDARHHRRLVPAVGAVGRGVREHRARCGDRRRPPGDVEPVRPAEPLRAVGWPDHVLAVRVARRGVPGAEVGWPGAPARGPRRRPPGAGDPRRGRDLRGLDPAAYGKGWTWAAVVVAALALVGAVGADPSSPRGLGLPAHLARGGRRGRADLREPVPQRHALDARTRRSA